MTAKVSCRASLECWSNVLSSATGCLDLADEVIRTVWEWLLLNKSVFAESCPECQEGGSFRWSVKPSSAVRVNGLTTKGGFLIRFALSRSSVNGQRTPKCIVTAHEVNPTCTF